jgi:GT2 family glycosyltransferase
MNPVLILTHNNLELTKRCVESVRAQDIKTTVVIVDNHSTDGTLDWLWDSGTTSDNTLVPDNRGVSYGWNHGLRCLFTIDNARHVLVIGNDTVLPPHLYRTLLSVNLPFVTGVAVDNMEQALQPPAVFPLTPNPDFSAFLIRREAWETIGKFDERMKHYCSDCDYHIRGHRIGVPMVKASVPFYHERSSTIRLASPEERLEIETQANKDREVFKGLYGCLPGSKEYEAIFL